MYPATEAEHCNHAYTQSINAPPAEVFPLLCPMREQEWIPGWRARMIHSRSGVAEDGALFATPGPRGETLWIVTAHEPPRRVQFVRFQPEGVVVRIDIAVAPDGEARSRVHVRYAFTAARPEAAAVVRDFTPGHWQRMMEEWESLMNRFLAPRAVPSP